MNLPDSVSQAARWALVVGLAYFGADAASAVIEQQLKVPPKELPASRVGSVPENVPAQAAPPGLITLMLTTAPEGDTEEESGPTGAQPAKGEKGGSLKPATPVQAPTNLTLKGTMAGGGGTGLAMIAFNGQTHVVSVGEEISSFRLTSVNTYSVQLMAGEQVVNLNMNSPNSASPNPRPAPVANLKKRPIVPRTSPSPNPTPDEPNKGAILSQRELRNILDNPAAFAGKGFRMKPVLKEGEIVGMRVRIRDQNHPLARLGIQNGDLVRSLNGTPLNGPEALTSIYRVLRNTSNLNFDVERNGAPQKVSITLEE